MKMNWHRKQDPVVMFTSPPVVSNDCDWVQLLMAILPSVNNATLTRSMI